MHYASDNSGPVHSRVIDAIVRANEGYGMPYGADAVTERAVTRIREIFEAPEAAVYLVATGSAANALLLASLCKPWETIYCADVSHVSADECGAPEFYSNGAKLTLVEAPDALMHPEALRAAIEETEQGVVHGVQRGPVSITTVSERGTIYDLDHLTSLTGVAATFGLPVHLDGARFANALAALGCTPAEMTWKAGVNAVSFGGTKNGLMGVEACILFDPAQAWEFELRRKRGGHLFSKHRYLSAQMDAYLTDGLWIEMARSANGAAARLAEGLRSSGCASLLHEPQANMIYATFPRAAHRRLKEAGAQFYSMGSLDGDGEAQVAARLVCDWSSSDEDRKRFLELLKG